jgi:hypothetical protein
MGGDAGQEERTRPQQRTVHRSLVDEPLEPNIKKVFQKLTFSALQLDTTLLDVAHEKI